MGDWAEDKERCQVFGASRPDPGDSWTHSQVKKMTGDNNIDSNTPFVAVARVCSSVYSAVHTRHCC